MNKLGYSLPTFLLIVLLSSLLSAQQTSLRTTSTAVVPRLVNYSGHVPGSPGKTVASIAGVTFSIYREQVGGAPLWIENQNVNIDARGNYAAQLGASKSEGLPLELFNTSEPRWLGVRVNGGEEQPRVLLLSVPYALKAADAETIGGLPPSAFLLAPAPVSIGSSAGANTATSQTQAVGTKPVTTAGGTTQFLPKFDGGTDVTNSQILDTGTNVGIGITTPAAKLDVNGTGMFRGPVTLAITGGTANNGKNSPPLNFTGSAFNSASSLPVNETFRLQLKTVNNNTPNPSGKLDFLFGSGTATPAETGLSIANNGVITFASGQTFPSGTGGGTVKSVALSAPSSDFGVSGSPVTSSGTLGLSWKVPPTASATANAIVKRDASGNFSAGTMNAQALVANNASGGVGVIANSSSSAGVFGGSGTNAGVYGISVSGHGIYGETNGATGFGVFGKTDSLDGTGVYGATPGSGGFGVVGFGNVGVKGISASIDGSGAGVYAQGRVGSSGLYASSDDLGWAVNAYNVGSGTGVLSGSFAGFAAWFNGEVEVDGNLHKEGGSFKIDHPLDPANKYLYHSFVESPDMMNIYNGNVTTNAEGEAVITLPEWFETLNRDFRYQLTVMGQFAQAIVAGKVTNHRFSIKTDKPNVEVSWQVTGIRQDAWANAHRIPVEETKPEVERGFYLRPELYGAPEEKSVLWARSPQAMKQWKEARTRAAQKTKESPPAQ